MALLGISETDRLSKHFQVRVSRKGTIQVSVQRTGQYEENRREAFYHRELKRKKYLEKRGREFIPRALPEASEPVWFNLPTRFESFPSKTLPRLEGRTSGEIKAAAQNAIAKEAGIETKKRVVSAAALAAFGNLQSLRAIDAMSHGMMQGSLAQLVSLGMESVQIPQIELSITQPPVASNVRGAGTKRKLEHMRKMLYHSTHPIATFSEGRDYSRPERMESEAYTRGGVHGQEAAHYYDFEDMVNLLAEAVAGFHKVQAEELIKQKLVGLAGAKTGFDTISIKVGSGRNDAKFYLNTITGILAAMDVDLQETFVQGILLPGIQSILEEETARAFEKKQWGSTRWKDYAPSTKHSNPALNRSNLLVSSGTMRNNAIDATYLIKGNSLVLDTSALDQAAPYWRVHNFGFKGSTTLRRKRKPKPADTKETLAKRRKKKYATREMSIPARPFIGVSNIAQRRINAFIVRTVKEYFKGGVPAGYGKLPGLRPAGNILVRGGRKV